MNQPHGQFTKMLNNRLILLLKRGNLTTLHKYVVMTIDQHREQKSNTKNFQTNSLSLIQQLRGFKTTFDFD